MTLFPTSIVSVEALGSAQANQKVVTTSVLSAEAVGVFQANQKAATTSIVSVEAFGSSQVSQEIIAIGVLSAESLGASQVNQEVVDAGVASIESFGAFQVNQKSVVTSIVSAEYIGSLTVVPDQILVATSIGSTEALGTSQVNQEVVDAGVASTEGFGVSQANQKVVATGVFSTEALGTSQANQEVVDAGVASVATFGVVQANQELVATSIVSAEMIGSLTVVPDQILVATSIGSTEALGTSQVNQEVIDAGVASVATFGIVQANQELVATSIVSAEVIGSLTVVPDQILVATSIGSTEALGTSQVNQELEVGVGVASVEVFGVAQFNRTSVITSIVSAEVFGSSAVGKIYNLIGDGGLSIGGNAVIRRVYNPSGNGLSGPAITIGGGGLLAPSKVAFTFQQQVAWQTNSKIDVSQSVSWNAGQSLLRWYRIQGCCRYPTEAGDGLGQAGLVDEGQPGGCDVIPFQSNDEGCAGALGKNQFIQNIVARNVSEVCKTLKELRWKWPICDIQRFSRPADSQSIADDDECNVLEPVEFCNDPECIEFCLDVDAVVKTGVTVDLIDSFINQISQGGVMLGGSASARVVWPSYIGNGGVAIGGSAFLSGEYWSYISDSEDANVVLDGESPVKSSYWDYTGSEGIAIGGEASFVSPSRGFFASGGISIYGSGQYLLKWSYIGSGGVVVGGQATLSTYVYHGIGGISLGGVAPAFITEIHFHGTGVIVIGGESPVVSPDWHFTGSGLISLGGISSALLDSTWWEYTGTGGGVLGGTATIRSSENGSFWYTGSGGINLDGTVFPWRYVGSGGVVLDGAAAIGGTWSGEYDVPIGAKAYIQDVEVNFFSQDLDLTEFDVLLKGLSLSASTNCSNCTEMPLVLEMSHNFNDTAVLREFLIRNSLVLPEAIKLRYSPMNKSWQGNLHYRGISDTSDNEDWSILVEWGCVDELGSIELGNFIWKFSLYIKRKNLFSGLDFDSRILLAFPATEICEEASRVGLDFSFAFDTSTQFVNADQDVVVDIRLLYDNIGLFKSDLWVENPDLLINISEVGNNTEVQRQDIKSIFPKDELVILGD